jgi:hypothetical protein
MGCHVIVIRFLSSLICSPMPTLTGRSSLKVCRLLPISFLHKLTRPVDRRCPGNYGSSLRPGEDDFHLGLFKSVLLPRSSSSPASRASTPPVSPSPYTVYDLLLLPQPPHRKGQIRQDRLSRWPSLVPSPLSFSLLHDTKLTRFVRHSTLEPTASF